MLNCEGGLIPSVRVSADRIGTQKSISFLCAGVRGAPLSLAPSLPPVSQSTPCVSVARQSRAELSRAAHGGRSQAKVVVLLPVIHHCDCKVKKGRIPGVVCRQKCVCTNSEPLACTHTHECTRAHASARLGHQRSSHRVILPRRESKDILDSGSKSQQANGEQQEVCSLPGESRRNQEFGRNCWILHWHGVCVDYLLLWSLLNGYVKVTFSEILLHLLFSI